MGDDQDERSARDILDFAAERDAEEHEAFEGDHPKTSTDIVLRAASELSQVAAGERLLRADESEEFDEEALREEVSMAAANVLYSLGAIEHEYDTDVIDAARGIVERVEQQERVREMQEEADDMQEFVEQMEDDSDVSLPDDVQLGPVDPGTNVNDDSYDVDDDNDRHFQ